MVKPAYTLQSHDGVLLLLSFSFLKLLFNHELLHQNKGENAEGSALLWWRTGKQISLVCLQHLQSLYLVSEEELQ